MQSKFFDERTDQSEIKARIVQKYFSAWCKVIAPTSQKFGSGKIAYIDLYAGPGRYRDGAASTPLLVLESAIADLKISQMLVTVFNDADANFSNTLRQEIDALPNIKNLKYAPKVLNSEVGEDFERMFSDVHLVPTFSFIDPFGYKGLSLKIVNGVIKDWGCDCVFFFNYSRINAGISNERVEPHINALFGEQRAERIRTQLIGMSPQEREFYILEELSNALKEMGGTYVLPFRFKNESGKRTSHCLVFVSKHVKGYEIMKDIMAKESTLRDQGVPSFTYSPADERYPLLFSLSRPMDALKDDLLKSFAGERLTTKQIYDRHHVDTPFILSNYKQALRDLETEDRIITNPPAKERPKRKDEVTFADSVLVEFPK